MKSNGKLPHLDYLQNTVESPPKDIGITSKTQCCSHGQHGKGCSCRHTVLFEPEKQGWVHQQVRMLTCEATRQRFMFRRGTCGDLSDFKDQYEIHVKPMSNSQSGAWNLKAMI